MLKAILPLSSLCAITITLSFGLPSLAQFSIVVGNSTPGINRSLTIPQLGRFDGNGNYIQTQPYDRQYIDPSLSRPVIINNGGVNCNYCQTSRPHNGYYPNNYGGGYNNRNYNYGYGNYRGGQGYLYGY